MPAWVGPVARYMLEGLVTTAELAVLSVTLSVAIGVVLGTLITIPSRPLRALIRLYIEVWRGLPVIVTLFLIFFSLPVVGLRFGHFVAAIIGLTLWGSAQVAEAARGAVQSIPHEQGEAGAALGLSWVQCQAFVIVPQALRRLLPPLISLLTNLIQNSTLGAVIGVLEVLEAGQRSIARLTLATGATHAVAILGAVMVIFFVICFPLTRLSAYLERRLVT